MSRYPDQLTANDRLNRLFGNLNLLHSSPDTRGEGRVLALKSGMNKQKDAAAIRKVGKLGISNGENSTVAVEAFARQSSRDTFYFILITQTL